MRALLSCPAFLALKFKSGEPCGDTLRAILDGKDGSRRPRDVVLQRLQIIEHWAQKINSYGSFITITRCHKCFKEDAMESFMVCSRCKIAYYCSEECQKAHWKLHKKLCYPSNKTDRIQLDGDSPRLKAFMRYLGMRRLLAELARQNQKADDMVLWLDYVGDKDDDNIVPPPMRDPPIYSLAPRQNYINGAQPDGPGWLLTIFRENFDLLSQSLAEKNFICVMRTIDCPAIVLDIPSLFTAAIPQSDSPKE